jgi:hypothetical protein
MIDRFGAMIDRINDGLNDWLGDGLHRFLSARVRGVPVVAVVLALVFLVEFIALIWFIFYSQPLCTGGTSCPTRTLPWE